MKRHLLLLPLTVAVLTLAACSDSNKDKKKATPETVEVKQGSGAACPIPKKAYSCQITVNDKSGNESKFDMDLRSLENNSRQQILSVEGFEYLADGRIHQATNSEGVQIRYAVNCTATFAELAVNSTNSSNAMRLRILPQTNRELQLEVYVQNADGNYAQGTGLCR